MVISVLKNICVLSHSYNVHLGESKCQVHRVYEFISGKPFPPWKLIYFSTVLYLLKII